MLEMLGSMVICESSDLVVEDDDVLIESVDDERIKSKALNNIFTSVDPTDRSLVSIADIWLNREAYKK